MSITFIFTFAAEHYALLFCLHQCRILLPFPSTSSSLDLLFIPLFFSPLFYTPISIFTPKSAFLILSYLLRSLLLSFFLSVSFQKNFSIFLISISLLYSLRSRNSHPVLSSIPLPFLYLPAYPYLPRTLSISLYLVFLLHFHYTLSISLSFYTIPSSLAHSYHPPSHPIPLSIPSLPSLGTCS